MGQYILLNQLKASPPYVAQYQISSDIIRYHQIWYHQISSDMISSDIIRYDIIRYHQNLWAIAKMIKIYPDAPWCWYILPTWLGDFVRANVGVHISAPWSIQISPDFSGESGAHWAHWAHWLAAASRIYLTILVLDPEDIHPMRCSDLVATWSMSRLGIP